MDFVDEKELEFDRLQGDSVKLTKRRFDHVTESLIDVDCPR